MTPSSSSSSTSPSFSPLLSFPPLPPPSLHLLTAWYPPAPLGFLPPLPFRTFKFSIWLNSYFILHVLSLGAQELTHITFLPHYPWLSFPSHFFFSSSCFDISSRGSELAHSAGLHCFTCAWVRFSAVPQITKKASLFFFKFSVFLPLYSLSFSISFPSLFHLSVLPFVPFLIRQQYRFIRCVRVRRRALYHLSTQSDLWILIQHKVCFISLIKIVFDEGCSKLYLIVTAWLSGGRWYNMHNLTWCKRERIVLDGKHVLQMFLWLDRFKITQSLVCICSLSCFPSWKCYTSVYHWFRPQCFRVLFYAQVSMRLMFILSNPAPHKLHPVTVFCVCAGTSELIL